jgi:hypothetical protein
MKKWDIRDVVGEDCLTKKDGEGIQVFTLLSERLKTRANW